jgi:5-methylcytosine-specific restriction protein A
LRKFVLYDGNMRQFALSLDRVAIDRSARSGARSRARTQAKRARHFDSLLQRAYRKSEPLRVIVLEGKPQSQPDHGWDTSKVQYRVLDYEVWYVHSYSYGDGSCSLVRKIPPERVSNGEGILPTQPVFVDQFSLPEYPTKHESTGFIFDRSSEVRRAVLNRASGVCECCAAPGFKMDNGGIFLETHHVVPLSENGLDRVWNVVALCPNDHRRAHFGEDHAALREQFLAYLSAIYSNGEDSLRGNLEADSNATLLS